MQIVFEGWSAGVLRPALGLLVLLGNPLARLGVRYRFDHAGNLLHVRRDRRSIPRLPLIVGTDGGVVQRNTEQYGGRRSPGQTAFPFLRAGPSQLARYLGLNSIAHVKIGAAR